jgi:16S rRNA (uracil1498-N3)-methyltransferase
LTSNHFFIKKSLAGGECLYLEGREHRHLSKVVRLQPQDEIWLFDEEGAKYRARIEHIGRQKTRLSLIEKLEPSQRRLKMTLAQALLKAKPMDWVIQKATELGVFSIVPVLTSRCVVKLEDRIAKKVERWNQIALEASKQCRSGLIPNILAPQPLDNLIRELQATRRLFLSENKGRPLKEVVRLSQDSQTPSDVVILIGPEGGWTNEEEVKVLRFGYEAVSLGKNILRAETASLAAVAIIAHFWNS